MLQLCHAIIDIHVQMYNDKDKPPLNPKTKMLRSLASTRREERKYLSHQLGVSSEVLTMGVSRAGRRKGKTEKVSSAGA